MSTDDRPRLTLGQAAKASGLTKPTVRARLVKAGFDTSGYVRGGSGTGWLVPVEHLLAAGVPIGKSRPTDDGQALAGTVGALVEARSATAETDLLRARLDAATALSDERGRHLDDLRRQLDAATRQVEHLTGLVAVMGSDLAAARGERAARRGLPWRRRGPEGPVSSAGTSQGPTG